MKLVLCGLLLLVGSTLGFEATTALAGGLFGLALGLAFFRLQASVQQLILARK